MKKTPYVFPMLIFSAAALLCLSFDANSSFNSLNSFSNQASLNRTSSGSAIYKAVITKCESPDGQESHTHIECLTGFQECEPKNCPTTAETTVVS